MLTMKWNPDFFREYTVLFAERANELVVCGKLNLDLSRVGGAKASLNRAFKSQALDPKPGDLFMARVNPDEDWGEARTRESGKSL